MFIGHLPGAYLAFRAAAPRLGTTAFAAGMIGSVAPDLDMLWFYLVDNGAHHHHDYITHRPALWAGVLGLGLLLRLALSRAGLLVICFAAGGLIHMGLDSIVGKITWGWPLSDHAAPLVIVPATRSHWILSFLTHWTFLIELAITATAFALWRWVPRQTQP